MVRPETSNEVVRVELGDRSYDIVIGEGLLARAGSLFGPIPRSRTAFLAWDENVASPHGKALLHGMEGAGIDTATLQLPAGEPTKCVRQLDAIWDALSERHYGRDCAVVALGGGVTGDLVGFAAATYLRGVDFIQVPTSLLAMVDSSVGGKTGINNRSGKNLLGAFWQPRLVLIDLETLETLPREEYIAATAEIIKYGVIYDAEFFAWLETGIEAICSGDRVSVARAIRRSCEIKAAVVSADEREGGLREILNFGHTVGHAIENIAGYGTLRHGEAVAIGMVAESLLGMERNPSWSAGEHARLVSLIERAGLPVRLPGDMKLSTDDLLETAKSDKKARAGKVRYVLPQRFGAVATIKLEGEVVVDALKAIGAT